MSIKPIFETVEQVKKGIDNLSVDDLKKELERDDLLLIDIREIQEHVDLGTIPGATLASRGMLEFWADPARRQCCARNRTEIDMLLDLPYVDE